MWTQFMDMHSGGKTKVEPYEYIYIEAPEKEAKVIFYNRFGRNPERVTCTCCGDDYSIDEGEDLAWMTGYHRGCDSGYVLTNGQVVGEDYWQKASPEERKRLSKRFQYFERPSKRDWAPTYQTLEDYCKRKDVLIVRAGDIKDAERVGTVPRQGYVWMSDDK